MSEIGKLLIVFGLTITVIGMLMSANLLALGRLPGDILVKRGNFTFYFPLATSIVVSVVLSLMFWLLGRKP